MTQHKVSRAFFLSALIIGSLIFCSQIAVATQEQLDQASAFRMAGQFPEAEEMLRLHIAERPDDVDAIRRLSEILAFQEKFSESEAMIEQALTMDSNNSDVRLTYARILSWTQRFRAAENIVDDLLLENPDGIEYLTFKGRLLMYQSKFEPAEQALEKALMQNPQDMEVLLALGDLMRARNNEPRALTYYLQADELYPNDEQITSRIERPELSIEQPLEVRFGYARSSISRVPLEDWQDFRAIAAYRFDLDTRVIIDLQHSDRFGLNDTFLGAEVIQQFGEPLIVGIGAGATGGADFLQKWQVSGHFSYKISGGNGIFGPTILGTRGEIREYAAGKVKTITPNVVQYFTDIEIWLSLNWINAWDTVDNRTSGIMGRIDYQVSDRWRFYGGYAKAPESDRGLVTDTDSWFVGAVINFNRNFFAEFTYSEYDRTGSYIQRSGQVGVGIRY